MCEYYFLLPDLSAGGAERVSITIARILQRHKRTVRFINIGHPDGEMKDWIVPEFEMISLGCSRVLAAFKKLYTFLQDKPNAVLFSSREHLSLVAIVVARLLKIPIVVRVPNMPNNVLIQGGMAGFKERIIKKLNSYLLPYAKFVIAQNEEMAIQLKTVYGRLGTKVITINNPVDKESIIASTFNSIDPYKNGNVNFLSVCNISYAKGVDVLLKAFIMVRSIIPNAHLTVVGRATSEYAKNLVNSALNDDHISFVGFQSNPYPYLKYCNVFVLSSRMEGFPNVVLEAMCFNRPVVATRCVNVIENIIREGDNGYSCAINDELALAECMVKAVALSDIDNKYEMFDLSKLLKVFH